VIERWSVPVCSATELASLGSGLLVRVPILGRAATFDDFIGNFSIKGVA